MGPRRGVAGQNVAGQTPVAGRFGKGTRADSEQALLRLRLELFDGTSSKARDTTVAELLAAWFNWASPRLSPSTRREYDRIVGVHLVPSLGGLPLGRLRRVDIDLAAIVPFVEVTTPGGQ